MELSIAGILVCCVLLLIGFFLGSPIIIPLFASLPFKGTAFVTLGIGGPSPLIFTIFAAMLLLFVASRRRFVHEIGILFHSHWVPWVVLFLTIYVAASAVIFPRLFIGQTTVFLPGLERITEKPLAPVSGNVTQVAYFALGAMVFFGLYLLMKKKSVLGTIRQGFLIFAAVQVTLGAIDIGGKLAGLGDILAPIRTASYSMLTLVEAAGFWRIAGGCSEASAFADISVPCLAFVVMYWRATGSGVALTLALALFGFLLFSTSSTAYVALAVLALILAVSLPYSMFANRLIPRDLVIVVLMAAGLALLIAVYLANEKLFDPFYQLVNSMVFEKLSSGSGIRRVYWSTKSLESLVDTNWLGIGMGSSRTSSWVVAVLSQLGIIGALMMGALVVFLLRGLRGIEQTLDRERVNIVRSVRAAGLASLLTVSVSGGHADPGLIFFISLAVLLSFRQEARSNREHLVMRMGRSIVPDRGPLATEDAKG